MPSKDFGDRPIRFHVDTPLTKSELLYAIETTFTLNNLAIIPVDDRRIRLGLLMQKSSGITVGGMGARSTKAVGRDSAYRVSAV